MRRWYVTTGFAVAGALDVVDGYVARRFNQQVCGSLALSERCVLALVDMRSCGGTAPQSVLGSFMDPVADKVLVGSMTITLGIQGVLSPWLVGLIVARDLCLIGGIVVIRARTKPEGAPFFSLSHAKTFEIKPSTLSKVSGLGHSKALLCEPLAQRGTGCGDHR